MESQGKPKETPLPLNTLSFFHWLLKPSKGAFMWPSTEVNHGQTAAAEWVISSYSMGTWCIRAMLGRVTEAWEMSAGAEEQQAGEVRWL